jgi:hypothetical protein
MAALRPSRSFRAATAYPESGHPFQLSFPNGD